MNPVFLKELQDYSQDQLMALFSFSNKEFLEFATVLSKKKILFKNKNSYKLRYVGFFIFNNRLCFSFPKYTKTDDNKLARDLINLFREYSSREKLEEDEIETLGSLDYYEHFSLISVIIFILQDYFDNGIYIDEISTYEIDGNGEINWDKTIENIYAYNLKNQSIYLNFYTDKLLTDEKNIITTIHKYVLSECSAYIQKTGMDLFFEFPNVNFDIEQEEIGSIEFMLSHLQDEINIQYNDWKQLVLKTLYMFLSNKSRLNNSNSLSLFGTRSFHNVWEKVCSFVFNSIYSEIKEQGIIDKPVWELHAGKNQVESKRTLTPDIITKHSSKGEEYLLILDAKYYNPKFKDKSIHNTPELEDITKQYMYELALKDYYIQNGYTKVINAFLFPNENNEIEVIGKTSIDFLKKLSLQDITLINIPGSKVYENYIRRQKFSVNEIDNMLEKI
ncbi:LlaJI family restriction endonuclease [Priestia aryabhattai]|uniref:LlaJI family restriction endonuclease n=1 Tax=Priestia aryabhattai TaxID=412384 RepID=UPI0015F40B7E|nr:LlaJI family restriction endonuclease [Priestia aryabhattai]